MAAPGLPVPHVANKPSPVEHGPWRFLIIDMVRGDAPRRAPRAMSTHTRRNTHTHRAPARPRLPRPPATRARAHAQPTEANLEAYIREMKAANVTDLVRATEHPTYSRARVEAAGVAVHNLPFPDGEPPPAGVIKAWLALCGAVFAKGNPARRTIAVHCVAGLGRAPVLVAIALIEAGVEPLDAVATIRAKRRGAINAKQLSYVEDYKKRRGACEIV